jgi:uncharacterized protein (TIGR00251 family)
VVPAAAAVELRVVGNLKTAQLKLWVQPRAPRSEVLGLHGDAIKIKLAAPPVDGAANEELVRFLAEKLTLPRSAITLVRGAGSRRKTVEILGLDAGTAEARLLRPTG